MQIRPTASYTMRQTGNKSQAQAVIAGHGVVANDEITATQEGMILN